MTQKIGKRKMTSEPKNKSKAKGPEPRQRHWCLTTFDTKKFKTWADTLDTGIRYMVYQLERCESTGKIHIQAYVEFYKQFRRRQVKSILQDNTLHCEVRKGTRDQARDYCMKEEDHPWYAVHYPEWDKGFRLIGTVPIEIGTYAREQGHRSDLVQVTDMIKNGSTEFQILEECPQQYLKYSGHIKRAINLYKHRVLNTWHDIKCHVLWGDAGSGKTRRVFDEYGPENVYCPIWTGTKWWFDGYTGQKVLLINEFYGQCRTAVMQKLLDKYRMLVEDKGSMVTSNWDTIYITSNVHPSDWYNSWQSVPLQVEKSFMRRITSIEFLEAPPAMENLTWESLNVVKKARETVLPLATSEPDPKVVIAGIFTRPCYAGSNKTSRLQEGKRTKNEKGQKRFVEARNNCCQENCKKGSSQGQSQKL